VTLLAFVLVSACLLVLSGTETQGAPLAEARGSFLPLMFEAVSAFGTVGLSMGATPELSAAGRLVVVVLMFVGRVGPLAFFAAVALRTRARPTYVRPAREDVIVG
jgi:trk system potassium uptake protein TrkH